MDAVRKLLTRAPASLPAVLTRAQLVGLRASLSELLAASPEGPGAEECRGVLRELESLPGVAGAAVPEAGMPDVGMPDVGMPGVGAAESGGPPGGASSMSAPSVSVSPGPSSGPPPVARVTQSAAWVHGNAPSADPELSSLAGELVNSPEAVDYLGPAQLPAGADTPALWRWFQLTLLRLPAAQVTMWRARAERLAVAEPAGARWTEWAALDREQVVLPPLPRFGAAGVRLGPRAGAAPWALDAAGIEDIAPADGESRSPAQVWAVLASWVAALAELDDQAHHCVESLTHRGALPLADPGHRRAYQQELALRLGRLAVRREADDPSAELQTALAVDEALCSVVHLPPAAPGSWWAQIAETSQRAVLDVRRRARAHGADVAVEVLAPSYREARRRTGGNDIPLDAGGRKGQVLAGLRLWARIDGRELPGRVVYRG
ncbi:hypothetical protein SAMN04487980_1007188 [Streptomyces sp. cf124]|uniref:hypothetical protein n=1 Tax=Streptomyces sp. cf124 TaxID=1761903 RepID=UPI0008E23111|nr:hypothetical protein [Streptomyces sp. cf124]SFM91287.1 hypothetical protein SAMN04487980_1007188 [Streptomyces sp. cf124]